MGITVKVTGKKPASDQAAENRENMGLWRFVMKFFTWENDKHSPGYGRWIYKGPDDISAQEMRDLIDTILDERASTVGD